jgi:hypothetical protein
MDEWAGETYGHDTRNDATWNVQRANLGYALTYAARLDLANATAQGSLANTGFALAKTTGSPHQYLAYQDVSGNVTLDVSSTAGTLTVEWLRPGTGATQAGGTVSGGASRSLTNPWPAEDAVVYLWQSTYAKQVSDGVTVAESVTVAVSVQGTLAVSVSDAAALAESIAAAMVRIAAVTDTATVAESVTVAPLARAASATDSATMGEAVTAALGQLAASATDTATATVNHNRLLGTPSYAMYSEQTSVAKITGTKWTNNEIQKGAYGYWTVTANTVVKSGNVDAFTGANIDGK